MMVIRMKPILDKIISPTQNGFILGRQILDAVIASHEVLNSMEKSGNPSMALKVDIPKAYDKVRMKFLIKILMRLGFGGHFISLIDVLTNTVQFLVIVNGSLGPFFLKKRGIRQGNLLSPYLFIMVAEILGRNILELVAHCKIKGINPTMTLPLEDLHLLMILLSMEYSP